MKKTPDSSLYVHDPILPPGDAARYLGFRGKNVQRSIARLGLKRDPMPGIGTTRFGYRLSTLNAYMAAIADPASRVRRAKSA